MTMSDWPFDGTNPAYQLKLPSKGAAQKGGYKTESDTITQRIAAGTQDLHKDNVFTTNGFANINHNQLIVLSCVFQSPCVGHQQTRHSRSALERKKALQTYATRLNDKTAVVSCCGSAPWMTEPLSGSTEALSAHYEASFWVNRSLVGTHRGGHVPFQFDVTDTLDADTRDVHRVTVRVCGLI
jgi:hypothetical protein